MSLQNIYSSTDENKNGENRYVIHNKKVTKTVETELG